MSLRLGALHDAQEPMANIDTRLTVLTWMVAMSITLQLLTLGGLLGLIWRGGLGR